MRLLRLDSTGHKCVPASMRFCSVLHWTSWPAGSVSDAQILLIFGFLPWVRRTRSWTGCSILKIAWILYEVPVSDFLPVTSERVQLPSKIEPLLKRVQIASSHYFSDALVMTICSALFACLQFCISKNNNDSIVSWRQHPSLKPVVLWISTDH